MKIVVFGTGKVYQKQKNNLKEKVEIVAFIDNSLEKQGTTIDEKKVYLPNRVLEMQYDYIVIFSVFYDEMRNQLLQIGVECERIIIPENYYKVVHEPKGTCYGDIEFTGKTIAVFSHALTFTGAQNVLWHGAKLLKKNGFNVIVISNTDGELRQKLVDDGITVYHTNDYSFDDGIIKRIVTCADYIWINTLWLYYLIFEYREFSAKIVWWIHESGALNDIGIKTMKTLLMNRDLSIYSVSSVVTNYIENRCGCNGVIEELCFGIPDRKCDGLGESDKEKVVFLQIGPYCELKGTDILVRAFDSLENGYKEKAVLYIVGSGNVLEGDKHIIDRNERIHFVGKVDNSMIPEMYNQSDYVVCASREESMSIAVMEGFAFEKPAIVSNVTGISKYMTEGQEGYIFESENTACLAEKMKHMIDYNNHVFEMKKSCRKLYDDNFTMEIYENRLLSVFK